MVLKLALITVFGDVVGSRREADGNLLAEAALESDVSHTCEHASFTFRELGCNRSPRDSAERQDVFKCKAAT